MVSHGIHIIVRDTQTRVLNVGKSYFVPDGNNGVYFEFCREL